MSFLTKRKAAGHDNSIRILFEFSVEISFINKDSITTKIISRHLYKTQSLRLKEETVAGKTPFNWRKP